MVPKNKKQINADFEYNTRDPAGVAISMIKSATIINVHAPTESKNGLDEKETLSNELDMAIMKQCCSEPLWLWAL